MTRAWIPVYELTGMEIMALRRLKMELCFDAKISSQTRWSLPDTWQDKKVTLMAEDHG